MHVSYPRSHALSQPTESRRYGPSHRITRLLSQLTVICLPYAISLRARAQSVSENRAVMASVCRLQCPLGEISNANVSPADPVQ